jgi:pimeloyl-ACP methyl ester carboxylesterase
MTDLHLVVWGEGVPVIFVHGSMSTGTETFAAQKPLSEAYRLILLDRRGYGGSPFTRCSDFDVDAHDILDLLEHPSHIVGHSYGAVACLIAAAMHPEKVRSLTVIEPPAFGLVRGQRPVELALEHLKAAYARSDPLDFYFAFTGHPDDQPRPELHLTEADISGIRTAMHQRPAWEARIDLAALAAAPFPKLVVSGGRQHLPEHQRQLPSALALQAVCDLLTEQLGAQRAVFDKAAHNPQIEMRNLFNLRLRAFLDDATAGQHGGARSPNSRG